MGYDRLVEVLLVIVGLAVVAWLLLRRKHERSIKEDAGAQRAVEALALRLLERYWDQTDEEIATLVRDELLNAGQRHPSLFKWATTDTVSRLRRTIVRSVVERPSGGPRDPRLTVCSQCDGAVSRYALSCPHCGQPRRPAHLSMSDPSPKRKTSK